MIDSQSRYPLAKLQLAVPKECVAWGAGFKNLCDAAQPAMSLHPKDFGDRMAALSADFSEEKIKGWFEKMGNELSVQAKSQWG